MTDNSKAHIFKATFIFVLVGLTTGQLVYKLLTHLLDEEPVTGQSIVKAFAVGILTAVVLALLNMYLKLFPFNQK
ncbi:MAG TPA: hypothetical protein VGB44_09190 [Flavobacterium sp.]|jgi:hypothetical protein